MPSSVSWIEEPSSKSCASLKPEKLHHSCHHLALIKNLLSSSLTWSLDMGVIPDISSLERSVIIESIGNSKFCLFYLASSSVFSYCMILSNIYRCFLGPNFLQNEPHSDPTLFPWWVPKLLKHTHLEPLWARICYISEKDFDLFFNKLLLLLASFRVFVRVPVGCLVRYGTF